MDEFKEVREWLAALKTGDQVIVTYRYHVNDSVHVVEHATTNYVTVKGTRYNRKSGYGCGESRLSIQKPTPEALDRIELHALRNRLGWMKWDTLPLDKLREVAAVLDR